ncbi:putative transmembrane protein [Gregarina niphandrodes]|uniref:Transmembrane protein n=1 Tax=Gregarina niphandrodes TaxID=110365 RepID=A0A023BB86_GRENI|nr:putative transmembrane protein [Gregarina niphandrodes]EZG78967.1 putative transmembrane protein [Gregarina niphandrodes]|eukprot:XP_011129151.1 putative transmembrane protein [Gregarina niphandrodes]
MLATIVLFISHIWNSLCVETTTEDLGAVDSWNRVITKCYHGEQCYAIADASDLANLVGSWPSFGSLLKTTLWWDLDPVCDKLINLTPVEAEAAFLALSKAKQRQRATICHRLWPSGSWTVGVGNVAIGLAMMLTTRTLFEVATMLLLKRSRHRVFNMGVLVDVVIGILALLLAYDMVRNSFWGLSAASNDFACIVVLPVVLYQARRTARTIKMVRLNESDERLRKLQETQLGKEIDALAHGRETTQGTIDNEEGTTYTRAKGFISRLMNRVPKSP